MEDLTLREAFEFIENEATSLEDYDDYRKAMDLVEELKTIFKA